jgi:hypothetical protein
MQQQSRWVIADISRFVDAWDDDDPGYEYQPVDSKEQLASILSRSTGAVGSTFSLEADDGRQLGICVSERFGALMYRDYGQRVRRRVRPRDVTAAEPCLFRSEGVVSEVLPEDLLPAEDVIRLALLFFENAALPGTVVLDPP